MEILYLAYCDRRSQWLRRVRRGSAAASLLEFRVRISVGALDVCLLRMVYVVQVQASATGRSLDQRSPTECVCH
jgi:hypothetical protein